MTKKGPSKIEKHSLLTTVAEKYELEPSALTSVLKATVMPKGCTNEQLAMFLMVCHKLDLNPVTGEIYAIQKKGGGIQVVVGVDGYITMIHREDDLDGIDFKIEEVNGKLYSCTCSIYRKSMRNPVSITEYWSEVNRNTNPWQTHPRRMLRHKALIQCARVAFGYAGLVDADEAERIREVKPVYDPLVEQEPVKSLDHESDDAASDVEIQEPDDVIEDVDIP